MVLLAASQAATGWLERLAPAFAANDPTLDMLDWRGLTLAVTKPRLRERGMIVATVSWIDAGKADYALAAPCRCFACQAIRVNSVS